VLQFGSSHVEEGGSRLRTVGGAAVPMEAGGGSRFKSEVGADVPGQKAERSGLLSMGVKYRRKWAERQNGPKAKETAA
jgi:hypothetical protein